MSGGIERPIVFGCCDERLVGVLHLPVTPARMGVVVVVGGPQYRVGSHRQFILLARFLAQNGVAVFRFDYRGMGDSDGETRTFEEVNQDMRAAIDTFLENASGVERVMLWGLCDAASAVLFYAHQDSRVEKLLLLNPWVRTESGQAKAYLRHYYIKRVLDKGFWKKLFSGAFNFSASVRSLFGSVRSVYGAGNGVDVRNGGDAPEASTSCQMASLPNRMLDGLNGFDGGVRVVISGDDLTAAEFHDLVKSSKKWRRSLKKKRVDFKYINEANHTFSRQIWRDQVADWSLQWVMAK